MAKPVLTYTITRWSSMFAKEAQEHVKCFRAPKAADELYRLIYEMIEADGLLDRPVAHRLITEVLACDTSAPEQGHYRTQTFYLRTADGAHAPFVEFRAERI